MGSSTAEAERLEQERVLVERAQAGDRDALRPLFERYADPLYTGVIRPRTRDLAAAEDALRETFLAAIEKIDTFEWQGRGIFGWLRQIAMNKVMDSHRRARRAGRLALALAEELPRATSAEERADIVLIGEEERREHEARIREALEGLSPRYRQAIELRLVEELGREECARQLAVTVGNFDVLFFRAVRAFRKGFGSKTESES